MTRSPSRNPPRNPSLRDGPSWSAAGCGTFSSPFLPSHRTITSPDGSFYFNNLFAGSWRLSLHRLAPDPDRPWGFGWPEGQESEVETLAGMTVLHEWDVPPDRFARFHITGTAQMDGRPLAHAVVRVYFSFDLAGLKSFLPTAYEALNQACEAQRSSEKRWEINERMHQLSELYRRIERTKKVPSRDRLPEDVIAAIRKPAIAVKADGQGRFDIALRRPGNFEVRLVDPQGKQELASARTTWIKPRRKDTGERQSPVHFNVRTGSLRLTLTTHETLRIPKRAIRLTQEPPGAVFRLRTDDQGDVFVRRIPAGEYRLSIDGPGLGEVELRNAIVNVSASTLNFHNAYTNPYARASAVGR